MKHCVKTALLAGTAFAAMSSGAWAQTAAPQAEATAVEDIVVTARRTSESAQRTPLALTAFSGETLARTGAQQVTDLQGAVPNLNLVQGRGSSNATNIYIRGVGQPDALQTFDPAVGVYVDDVYYSRIRGTQFDLLDLERVEVLRGPQGTLYGKNTIGGALKLVSRRPGQDFRARASAAYGDYDMIDVQGSVSGPITDTLALGLSALHSERGGYVTDPATGAEYNDKNSTAARASLAWDPASNLRIDLNADYAKDDAGMTVGQAQNTLIDFSGNVIKALPAVAPKYDFKTRATPGLPNETRLETWGTALRIGWDLTERLSLKSITSYRQLKTHDYLDFDATELQVADALVAVDQNQTSQELQLTYGGERLTAVGGLYWLKEDVTSHQESYNDALLGSAFLNSGFLRTIDDTLTTTSKAVYGNVSYAVTDALRLSAGVRYSEEEKDYWRTTSAFYNKLPAFNSTYVFAPPVGKWDDTSIMLSADYQLSADAMVYARYSQGFKSGGFNGRANSPTEATKYDPETADTFEVGAKTTYLDNRLRLNLAAFLTKYKDFQARVSGLDTDPITGLPAPVLSVINAGSLDILGFEIEGVAVPVRGLTLDTQIGFLDADYKEFNDARFTSFGGSRAFQDPAFSPRWTMRFGGQYEYALAGGSNLTFGAAAKYRSRMALAVDNTLVNSATELPGMYQEEYWLYDARVVWNDPSNRYSVGLYGQNLSDEVYRTDAQEFSSIGNIRTAYYGAPRTWMVKFTARY
ncbi:TonB-dependent receptor [Brevundimonas nasdae]|uniref:TonB-dependent receptor n=1 Tax=Brevundimonas nasdae TaxID=172043 RepID=A0ABX8TJH5_9CAUL|nr:TonB-dependent receptor [Brevundimonas nasdae]QYC12976.1 TonB-dependent receptor [Brevundimonas nasdae]